MIQRFSTQTLSRPRPTRRWLNLLILTGVLYFFANQTQVGWLYVIVALLLALLSMGYFLAKRNLSRVAGEIGFLDENEPAEWWEGDEVTFRYRFEAERGEGHQLALTGRCPVVDRTNPGYIKKWFLPHLGREGIAQTETVTLYKRGLFRFEPFIGESRFPFGLFYVNQTLPHPTPLPELIIYPEVKPLTRFRFLDERPVPQLPVNRGGHGNEFLSVRPYRPGDSPRHIHWRSVARTGQLVSKEFAEEQAPGVTLHILNQAGIPFDPQRPFFDLHSKENPFEIGIKIAASIGDYVLRQGFPLYLAGENAPRGPVTADMLWQYLARLTADFGEPDHTETGFGMEADRLQTDLVIIDPFANGPVRDRLFKTMGPGKRCLLIDFDVTTFPDFEGGKPSVAHDFESDVAHVDLTRLRYSYGQAWTDQLEKDSRWA